MSKYTVVPRSQIPGVVQQPIQPITAQPRSVIGSTLLVLLTIFVIVPVGLLLLGMISWGILAVLASVTQ